MSFGFTSMVHEVNRPNTSPCSQWVHVLWAAAPHSLSTPVVVGPWGECVVEQSDRDPTAV